MIPRELPLHSSQKNNAYWPNCSSNVLTASSWIGQILSVSLYDLKEEEYEEGGKEGRKVSEKIYKKKSVIKRGCVFSKTQRVVHESCHQ